MMYQYYQRITLSMKYKTLWKFLRRRSVFFARSAGDPTIYKPTETAVDRHSYYSPPIQQQLVTLFFKIFFIARSQRTLSRLRIYSSSSTNGGERSLFFSSWLR